MGAAGKVRYVRPLRVQFVLCRQARGKALIGVPGHQLHRLEHIVVNKRNQAHDARLAGLDADELPVNLLRCQLIGVGDVQAVGAEQELVAGVHDALQMALDSEAAAGLAALGEGKVRQSSRRSRTWGVVRSTLAQLCSSGVVR